MAEDYKLRTRIEDWREFFRSQIWADIEGMLTFGKEQGHQELIDMDLGIGFEEATRRTDFIRGRLDQIEQFRKFPETVVGLKEQQNEDLEQGTDQEVLDNESRD